MLYEFEYDIAGAIVTALIMLLFLIRHNYRSQSSHLFFIILVLNFIAAVTDIFANYTISYPTLFPLTIDYAASIVYLISYNLQMIFFVLFVNSVIDAGKLRNPINILCLVAAVFEILIILTTPITHSIIYFNEILNYCHGPLMKSLYVIAFIGLLICAFLVIAYHKQLNKYQVFSLCAFLIGIVACILFQMYFPRYIIGSLASGILFIFLYSVFENPGYYTYRDTQCFNTLALSGTINKFAAKKKPFSITAFEITEYKQLLRTLGHDKTSEITRQTAAKLYDLFKKEAYCLSETRFAVIHKYGDLEHARKVEEILYEAIDTRIFVTCLSSESIPNPELYTKLVIDELLDSRTPTANRSDIRIGIIEKSHRRAEIEDYLLQLIETNGFEVFYQPILDVEDNKFRSAEALVRLPMNGPIKSFPDEFIPIAESNGMISEIGDIVLRKVCKFMVSDEFKELGIHYIEVNLSPAQCGEASLANHLTEIVESSGLSLSSINFEITETAEINGEGLIENMTILSNRGASFSIDDFGSGFASADYLFSLPISLVKVDKMILWNAMTDENAMIVLKNTMHMVKELGKKIVVEGVETEEMADIVRKNGGDYMQGYLYSMPLSPDDFIRVVSQKNNDGIPEGEK